MVSDLFFIFHWWIVLFLLGIIFLPLTSIIFQKFIDKGYIFSKIIGILAVSYIIFLLGILKILPFTQTTIFFVLFLFVALNSFLLFKVRPSLRSDLLKYSRIFFLEEFLFFIILALWSYVRGFTSEIHGLEKFMDFGFVNSTIRADYFPPRDMWFTPFSINYYYFGHLMTAVLTKLSGLESFITYNLMIATLCTFTFVCSFSIGINLISIVDKKGVAGEGDPRRAPAWIRRMAAETEDVGRGKSPTGPHEIIAGLLSGLLVTFSGNLHTLYSLFKPYPNENPIPFWQLAFSPSSFPNAYWYPNATRFIHNTIHEFPLYSFVVSDLHGHVLSIPIVLTIVALLFSILLSKKLTIPQSVLISFLLAVAYMTNAWDGIIYFLLSIFVIFVVQFFQLKRNTQESIKYYVLDIKGKKYILHATFYLLLIGVGLIIFTFPFNIFFKPFVSGIGILCAPSFLTNIGHYGPFLFEKDHCQLSPWWQLLILYGFFYFFVLSFIAYIFKASSKIQISIRQLADKMQKYLEKRDPALQDNLKLKTLNPKPQLLTLNFELLTKSDIFVIILIILSTLLILVPEFIYAKDIYPAHYRANTMFKLVYQAFMMLSISSVYIFFRIYKPHKNKLWSIFSLLLFIFVMIYPYFAINSYYGNLKEYQGLDGLKYLKNLHPTDYEAILWLNKNIHGQPVILEAQGDSYTDYARVSANTGLPTVLGWTVHEWLWRGTYDIPAPRIDEVTKLYESEDTILTKNLIKKYKIKLVFLGDLERQKYPALDEQKFEKIGKVIYKNGQTKVYRLD